MSDPRLDMSLDQVVKSDRNESRSKRNRSRSRRRRRHRSRSPRRDRSRSPLRDEFGRDRRRSRSHSPSDRYRERSSHRRSRSRSVSVADDDTDVRTLSVHRINFRREPHLLQLKLQGLSSTPSVPLSDLPRVLASNAPRAKYRRIPHDQRSVNHWGQRKLLMSEIEFLTLYYRPGRVMVYAGAAPGKHIPYLLQLFPEMKFYLVDPSPFSCAASDDVTLHNGFFTDDLARELKEKFGSENILFVSDIRSADSKVMDVEEVEAAIARDMQNQLQWARLMAPVASMFKFRLPWGDGQSMYADGRIFLPVWGPQTTTETRLIVEGAQHENIVQYDNRKYEEQMFHFNTATRVAFYRHDYQHPGIDHCYDCAAELSLLEQYVHTVRGKDNRVTVRAIVDDMLRDISRQCSTGRTLKSNIDVRQRKSWFEARKFDPETQKVVAVATPSVDEIVKKGESVLQLAPRSIVVPTSVADDQDASTANKEDDEQEPEILQDDNNDNEQTNETLNDDADIDVEDILAI